MDYAKESLRLHKEWGGKIEVICKVPCKTKDDLSLAYTHLWTNNLTAGRGWIAVALVIFAFWRPGRAVFGAYLFGGIMALQLRLQATGTTLPSSLLLMLPYGLTIAVLVFSSLGRNIIRAPAGLGKNLEPSA